MVTESDESVFRATLPLFGLGHRRICDSNSAARIVWSDQHADGVVAELPESRGLLPALHADVLEMAARQSDRTELRRGMARLSDSTLLSMWCGLRSRGTRLAAIAWSTAFVWGTLWLTGKNSGEAARLWIVFLPWLVWLAGPMVAQMATPARWKWLRPVLVVLAIQLAVCALTVSRVNGFGFDQ